MLMKWAMGVTVVLVLGVLGYVCYGIEMEKKNDGIREANKIKYMLRRKDEFDEVSIGGVRVLEIRQAQERRGYGIFSRYEWRTVALVQSMGGTRFFCEISAVLPVTAGDTCSLRFDPSGQFCLEELPNRKTRK